MTRSRRPWTDPQVGDVVVTKTSGDGYGPPRRREIIGLTEREVRYDDGRYYTRWVRGEGVVRDRGASCVRSSWSVWCAKHATEYRRAGVDLLAEEVGR